MTRISIRISPANATVHRAPTGTPLSRPFQLAILKRLAPAPPDVRSDLVEIKNIADDVPLDLEALPSSGRSEIHIVCPTTQNDRYSAALLAEHLRLALVPVTNAPVLLTYGNTPPPGLLLKAPGSVRVRMLLGQDAETAFFAGPSEIAAHIEMALEVYQERMVGRLHRLVDVPIIDRTEQSQVDEWDGIVDELSPSGDRIFAKWVPLGKFQSPRLRQTDTLGVLRPRLSSTRSANDLRPFSVDYAHLERPSDPTPFFLTAGVLLELCQRNHVDWTPRKSNGESDRILFGLRGCTVADPNQNGKWLPSVLLKETDVDHKNLRCVVGVWTRSSGQICAFSASTVANIGMVTEQANSGGRRANLLLTGRYRYYVGPHKQKPGCFQQEGPVVVVRSNEDTTYTLFDLFDVCWPADNIHMAGSASSAVFSSAGCQTIPGRYDTNQPQANGQRHTGDWGKFRNAAGLVGDNDRVGCEYTYLLWTGRDVRILATEGGTAYGSKLRYGSQGPMVALLQEKLQVPQTGKMDAATTAKLVAWQRSHQGGVADGIVSGATAAALGIPLAPGQSPTQQPEPLPPLLNAAQISSALTYNRKIPSTAQQIDDFRALLDCPGPADWDDAVILATAREQDALGAGVDGKIGRETFTLRPDWAVALGVHSAYNDTRDRLTRGGLLAERIAAEPNKKTWKVTVGAQSVVFSYHAKDGDGYRVSSYEGFSGVVTDAQGIAAVGVRPVEQAIFWEIAHGESRKKMGAINTWDNQILSYGGVQFSGKAGGLARLVDNLNSTAPGREVIQKLLTPAGITLVAGTGDAAPTLAYTPANGSSKTEPLSALRAMKQDPIVLGAWMLAGNEKAMQTAQALTWAQRWLRPAIDTRIPDKDGPRIREMLTSQYSLALIAKLGTWMPAYVKPWVMLFIEQTALDLYDASSWNQIRENEFQQWFIARWDKSDLSDYAVTLSRVRGSFGS